MALILVTDDNSEHASYIEIALAREGHQVSVSPNGLDCLKKIENSGGRSIDLVITDIFMLCVTASKSRRRSGRTIHGSLWWA